MVVFEGKAFNEKKAVAMELVTVGRKETQLRLDLDNDKSIFWHYDTPETATSKMIAITQLINERENEILKIRYNS